jgi:ABC-type transporter Mla subunit MlaD
MSTTIAIIVWLAHMAAYAAIGLVTVGVFLAAAFLVFALIGLAREPSGRKP